MKSVPFCAIVCHFRPVPAVRPRWGLLVGAALYCLNQDFQDQRIFRMAVPILSILVIRRGRYGRGCACRL